jgi:hypothetical protein
MSDKQNYINHVALVLDASASMGHLAPDVIRVADEQIAYLARRSQELDQETRVTVYVFADQVKCVIYDKDVLRLPSLRQHYRAGGMTALVAATVKSQDDLAHTPELYGDHAFLTFVITDGQENASRPLMGARGKPVSEILEQRLSSLPDHWTVAVLVPDQRSVHEAKQFGFPRENIAVWDASSSAGFEEAVRTIRTATDTFMTNRAQGIRGSRSVFSTGAGAVNAASVRAVGLTPLPVSSYHLVPVPRVTEIRSFVQECGYAFRTGCAFYELTKTETIQASKQIAVLEKKTDKVYTGPEARSLIGLPDMNVRVKPDYNDSYKIFVQSTSVNRKLVAGTRLLIMT